MFDDGSTIDGSVHVSTGVLIFSAAAMRLLISILAQASKGSKAAMPQRVTRLRPGNASRPRPTRPAHPWLCRMQATAEFPTARRETTVGAACRLKAAKSRYSKCWHERQTMQVTI